MYSQWIILKEEKDKITLKVPIYQLRLQKYGSFSVYKTKTLILKSQKPDMNVSKTLEKSN